MAGKEDEYDYLFKGKRFAVKISQWAIILILIAFVFANSCPHWRFWCRKIQSIVSFHQKRIQFGFEVNNRC